MTYSPESFCDVWTHYVNDLVCNIMLAAISNDTVSLGTRLESCDLLLEYVSFTTTSFSLLCINNNKVDVKKKKMMFMIPNAKLAFCIEQGLLKLAENGLDPLTPFDPTVR